MTVWSLQKAEPEFRKVLLLPGGRRWSGQQGKRGPDLVPVHFPAVSVPIFCACRRMEQLIFGKRNSVFGRKAKKSIKSCRQDLIL